MKNSNQIQKAELAKSEMLPETSEFVNAALNTVAQGVESFRDGGQLSDVGDFVDEALAWPRAINGLAEHFPKEAKIATTEDIDEMFKPGEQRLKESGLNPLMVGAIVSNTKGIYFTYAAIVQSSNQQLVAPVIA